MKSSLIVILSALILLSGCTEKKEPVKIGFIGGLTGKVSPLGVEGRNGVELAVKDINDKGGINGHQVVLLTRDDRQSALQSKASDSELADEGVAAIIGHMTSAMSIAGAEVANSAGVLMMSPTTSTGELSGIDDMFFRVYPASDQAAVQLADYLYSAGHRKLAVIYDEKNRAHCESWYVSLQKQFEHLGGSLTDIISFSMINDKTINLIYDAEAKGADALFILANSLDTALIAQQLSIHMINIPIYSSEWSSNRDLITHGGKTVEGMIFFNTFNKYSEKQSYRTFVERYKQAFQTEPGFAAVHAYDSTNIIIQALQKNSNPKRLKETILKIRTFDGLQGEINFDKYGDVRRRHFLMAVKNGEFVPIKQ